ncbi:hypothetical protein GCM10007094_04610 [Pseudovibrio japonicus]|uniref:Uncharacterized protein n=1 Tax=Pseudovibrio japonicus TaxID=366534 RepID=A0ABQ3E4Y2_9HYPH|nr:hypothetical protein GCM10007094_04610 [Pseudovibrio japonicus]
MSLILSVMASEKSDDLKLWKKNSNYTETILSTPLERRMSMKFFGVKSLVLKFIPSAVHTSSEG